MRNIYRYVVPVDDEPHAVELTGDVQHVGSRNLVAVEFWSEHDTENPGVVRIFQVFGTGQPLPRNAAYVGTTIEPGGTFVWHLYELLTGLAL